MDWNIYENGVLVNTIYATEEFTKKYCEKNGYTYEAAPVPEPEPIPDPEPAVEDILNAMLGVSE
jgi:hypothetical protein